MKAQLLLFSTAVILFHTQGSLSSFPDNKSAVVSAPQNTEFSFFRTHRQGKNDITATWGLTSVDGVVSFIVQKTYQDPADPYSYWEDVTTVIANPSRSFKYTDENVLPGQMYYRITAMMADGSSVISEVSGVRILSH
ncbi:MAG: hypothetical protein JNK14_14950 [Chitinophagaceae bacterium]|nr:hypothetical protein [Chitinophagaceae bacterium]